MSAVFPLLTTVPPLSDPEPISDPPIAPDWISRGSTPSVEKPELPSTSNTSLTPPPATSDEVPVEMDVDQPADDQDDRLPITNGISHQGSDDWSRYRRQRGVRGFSAAQADVKLEPGEEEEEDAILMPVRNGTSHNRALSFPMTSEANTPSRLTPASVGSSSWHRKRRGEDQLLLDDHLLPKEMQKTGSLSGKRKGGPARDDDEGDDIEMDGQTDTVTEEALAVDGVDEAVEEDEEEGQDVTRCVCQRDGGLFSERGPG